MQEIATILLNYGIAGVVIYLFFTLITQKLSNLERHIDNLSDKIDRLTEAVVALREMIRDRFKSKDGT